MSEFKFACPHCGQHIAVDEGYYGQQIQCPGCSGAILIPQTRAASRPTGHTPIVVQVRQPGAPTGGGVPGYIWMCLFALSWLPCVVTVFWQRYQRWTMMRNAYRRAFSPGGEDLPIPPPSSWAFQENLVRWGAFGVCAVLAVFIITRHPGLRRRPLILSALVVGCLAVAWLANQLPGLPYRRAESTVAKQVVVETSGAPDAHVQSLDSASPVAKIRVQNPPQAITFVLELKKSLPELYEEQKYFLYGAGRINFDTRSQARVDAGRFEAQLVATLMARDQRGGLGDWANASMTIGNAKGHVIRSQLLRDQGPQSGPRPANPRMDMQRGRAEGKQILLTVKYGELGFVPGQTVWVAFVDEAASGYGGGQLLPSFQLVLK